MSAAISDLLDKLEFAEVPPQSIRLNEQCLKVFSQKGSVHNK